MFFKISIESISAAVDNSNKQTEETKRDVNTFTDSIGAIQ